MLGGRVLAACFCAWLVGFSLLFSPMGSVQGVRSVVSFGLLEAAPEALGVGWTEAGLTWWHVVCSVVREVGPGRPVLAGSSGPVC